MPRYKLNDNPALERLIFMGLLHEDGSVDEDIMGIFAGIFAGAFVWDVRRAFEAESVPESILELFAGLQKNGDLAKMYLLLSMQYDSMKLNLPEPVWWLSCSEAAVEVFMSLFAKRLLSPVQPESACEGDSQ